MSILEGLIVTTAILWAALLLRACCKCCGRSARRLRVTVLGCLSVVWCKCCDWLKWLNGDRHAHSMAASGQLVGLWKIHPHCGHYNSTRGSLLCVDHPSGVGGDTEWQGGAKARLVPWVALANAHSVNPPLQTFTQLSTFAYSTKLTHQSTQLLLWISHKCCIICK